MGLPIGTLFPLRLRLWFGRLLFRRELGPSAVRVSWHRIIKGPCNPPEIEALQYVAAHTSIPVPKIYRIHTPEDGSIFIEMEYVAGEPLNRAWHGMSAAQRDAVFADIPQHVASLRALPPPAQDVVCSALQNPAYDCRIGGQFYGPMSHDEFHSLARGHLRKEDMPVLGGDALAEVHSTRRYETRFAHADLSPYNIIVRDARVVAVIDWAFSGWYPEYWEFTKAHYNYFPGKDWEEYLARALPCYETELAAEAILWERLPEPGTARTFSREGVSSSRQGSRPSAAWLAARAAHEPQDLWTRCLSWRGISTYAG